MVSWDRVSIEAIHGTTGLFFERENFELDGEQQMLRFALSMEAYEAATAMICRKKGRPAPGDSCDDDSSEEENAPSGTAPQPVQPAFAQRSGDGKGLRRTRAVDYKD